jgi:zinc protease
VTYATEIVLAQMKKMQDGPTDAELDVAKRSIVDTLARRFATKSQTVAVFADEEYTGRFAEDPDYYAKYRERHLAVTKDDVARIARRLFDSPPVAILVVGKKSEIANPLPSHPVALTSLAKGAIVDVPLKDPMTLKPIAPAREAR